MADTAKFRVIEGNRRGTKVYVSDNFIYSTNRTVGITRYLRCDEKRDGCNGTATVIDGILVHGRPHSHSGDQSRVEKREAVSELKHQVETSRHPFRVMTTLRVLIQQLKTFLIQKSNQLWLKGAAQILNLSQLQSRNSFKNCPINYAFMDV